MKIIVYNNSTGFNVPNWYLLSDSAVSNTGKPFYLPEDLGRVSVSLGIAVRINRLGKYINQKFANRYYSEIAPVVHFKLPDFERKLREEGLYSDASRSFDKSLIVGEFNSPESFKDLELWKNNERLLNLELKNQDNSIDNVISEVSKLNTLKMGDIILPGLSPEIYIKELDFLEVKKDGERLFYIKIK